MASAKVERRRRIRMRIRNKLVGTATRPRLSVFRSNKGIYCQLIDDMSGRTLAQANSRESGVKGVTKTEAAKAVGQLIAQRSQGLNVKHILFDRGGYLYHGRVKALAEGAREGGMTF